MQVTPRPALAPIALLGGFTDPRIELVGGVELLIKVAQRGLGVIKMSHIVLGRVFGSSCIEQRADLLLQGVTILAFFH